LQHQDGHSHVLASTVPNLRAYDPTYAYELAVIIQDGIRRMYEAQESIFYYLTVTNENYAMPAMPQDNGVKEGILKGLYRLRASDNSKTKLRATLLGSGAILNEVLKAQQLLEDQYKVAVDVWSVTSYKQLQHDALESARWNMLHPKEKPRVAYVSQCLGDATGVFVAASDYMKTLPASLSTWLPGPLTSLGTDGFGRSEDRRALRDFFEVDHRYVTLAALTALAKQGALSPDVVLGAIEDLEINPEKANPMIS
jgi:pyruvate dehydrogenase E1 component